MNTELPMNVLDIFKTRVKAEQKKIMDNIPLLDSKSLQQIIFLAYLEFGFKYSVYRFEHIPKGIDASKMPPFAVAEDDGTIRKVGNTILTDGQLKQVLNQRKVTIAKFLDKGDEWHCFFYNYRSIRGEEAGGIPHIHYFSSSWNLTREYALNKFKEGTYPNSSTSHINYEHHRK
jgi:hypothetical protein